MDEFELDLIDNPPTKNPYFTLPDISNFFTEEESARVAAERRSYNSLVNLFGAIERMSDQQSTQFLLHILKNSVFEPDFDATADALNVLNGHQVKRRLEALLKNNGFKLDKDNHVTGGALAKEAKSSRASSKRTRHAKKAMKASSGSNVVSGNNDDASQSKKRRATDFDETAEQGIKRTRLALLDSDIEDGADVEDNESYVEYDAQMDACHG